MTNQDRINELCQQALRRGNWNDVCQERRDPSLEVSHDGETTIIRRPVVADEADVVVRAPEPVSAPVERPTVAPQAAADPTPKSADPVESDAELKGLIEEREGKLARRSKRSRILVNTLVLLFLASPVVAVLVSPTLKAKALAFRGHLGEGIEDVKQLGNATESYDEALGEIAGHGDSIHDATAMLGVDPDSVGADDDLEMTAEMSAFTGEEADGMRSRKAKLQTMGMVASKVTGIGEDKTDDGQAAK